MLRTLVDAEVVKQMSSKVILGEHALDCMAQNALITVLLAGDLCGSLLVLTTGITREGEINLFLHLVAGKLDFVSVDDDADLVAKYHVNSLPKLILVDNNGNEISSKRRKKNRYE